MMEFLIPNVNTGRVDSALADLVKTAARLGKPAPKFRKGAAAARKVQGQYGEYLRYYTSYTLENEGLVCLAGGWQLLATSPWSSGGQGVSCAPLKGS